MPLLINDQYGGGQEDVKLGTSKITPRETYSVDPRSLSADYSERMRNTNSLVDALSGLTTSLKQNDAKVKEEEAKQSEGIASSIIPQLKFGEGDGSVSSQLTSLRPDLNPRLVAATSEAIGRIRGDDEARQFYQTLYSNKEIANDPVKTSQAINDYLAGKATTYAKDHFFGPAYSTSARSTLTSLSNGLSTERTRAMAGAIAQDNKNVLTNILKGNNPTRNDDPAQIAANLGTATANSAKANEFWGNPDAPDFQKNFLTVIPGPNGKDIVVHKEAAPAFTAFFKELQTMGYDVKEIQSYANRNIRGTGTKSQHAWANALDINPFTDNGVGKGAKTNFPANMGEIAAKYGLVWGGDWKSKPDPMHFEFVGLKDGKPVPTAAISAGSRSALGSNVGNTTFSTDVYSRALKMGIPDHLAQLAAAQATLESGYGSSDIAKQGNNFFGIKSGSEWTGPTVDKNVDEVVDGKTVKQAAKFRKYENLDESIKDWYSVIQKNYPKSASATDLKGAIAGLSEGRLGAYSTSPDYAKKVTSVTDKVSGVVNSRYGNTEGLTPDILDKRRRLFDWDARQDIISHDLLSRTERKEQMIETVLTEAVTANNGMGNIDILAVLPKEIMGPDGKPRAFLTPEQDKKIQETRTSIISTQRSMAKAAEENRAAVEDSQIRTLKMAGLEAIANGERTPSAEWFAAAQKVSKEDMHDWFAKRAASNLDAIFTDPKYNYQQRSDFERDMRRAVARGEDVEKLTDKVLATPMHSENVKQLFEYAKSITSGPTKSILHDPLAGEMEKMLVERLRDQPIGAIMDGKVNPREPALRDKYYGFLLDEIKKANLNGAPSEIQKRAIVKAAAQHTADYFVDLGETKLKNLFDDSRKQTEPKKVELNAAQKVARGLLGIQ